MKNDDFILDPSHQDLDELQLDAERKLFQKEGSKRNKKKTLRTGGKKDKVLKHEGSHKGSDTETRKLKRGGKK